MSHPPSISHRVSLRFLPAPPTEHTATLVLNAGGRTSLYTDFRPFLPPADAGACEWAFAGAKERLLGGRCRWTHVVDSRRAGTGDGEGDEDEDEDVGLSTPLPDGSALETGTMRNPASGRVEPYEEVWRAERVPPRARVVALQLVGRGRHVRGVFVRVGRWAQGVLVHAGAVSARRWRFGRERGWELVAAYGADAPTMPALRGDTLDESTIDVPEGAPGSAVWESVEDYTWEGD